MAYKHQCTAKNRQGARCGRPAVPGLSVCRYHGGSTPVALAAAERRLGDERARAAAETLGLPREVDPHQALLEEVHRAAGVVHWVAARVAGLEAEAVATRRVITKAGDIEEIDDMNTWVRIFGEERDRLVRTAKAAIDAGVSERMVRLAEEQGRMVADAIRRIVIGLGLDPAAPEVRAVVRRELTVVAGAA